MEYSKAFIQWCSDKYRGNPEVYDSAVGALNHVPVVGHLKGGIHYAYGDRSKGNSAMEAATRSTAIVGGGIGGMAVGGPVGAAAMAAAAGGVSDAVATAVDSQANQAYKPHGIVKLMDKEDKNDKWQSVCGVMAWDALIGTASGNLWGKAVSKTATLYPASVASNTGWTQTWKSAISYTDNILKQYKESEKLVNRHKNIFSTIYSGWSKIAPSGK